MIILVTQTRHVRPIHIQELLAPREPSSPTRVPRLQGLLRPRQSGIASVGQAGRGLTMTSPLCRRPSPRARCASGWTLAAAPAGSRRAWPSPGWPRPWFKFSADYNWTPGKPWNRFRSRRVRGVPGARAAAARLHRRAAAVLQGHARHRPHNARTCSADGSPERCSTPSSTTYTPSCTTYTPSCISVFHRWNMDMEHMQVILDAPAHCLASWEGNPLNFR